MILLIFRLNSIITEAFEIDEYRFETIPLIHYPNTKYRIICIQLKTFSYIFMLFLIIISNLLLVCFLVANISTILKKIKNNNFNSPFLKL